MMSNEGSERLEKKDLPLTPAQRAELDRRLDAYEADKNSGRPAADVIAGIRHKLRRQ